MKNYEVQTNHYAYTWLGVIQNVKPIAFDQVVRNSKWENDMDEDLVALIGYQCQNWELMFLFKDKMAIECKWVYKVKQHVNASIIDLIQVCLMNIMPKLATYMSYIMKRHITQFL